MTADQLWQQEAAIVARLVDGVGGTLDPGIADTVTVLRLLGFPTEASCEGHLTHGFSSPWIEFTAGEEDETTSAELGKVLKATEKMRRAGRSYGDSDVQQLLARAAELNSQLLPEDVAARKEDQLVRLSQLVTEFSTPFRELAVRPALAVSSTPGWPSYRLGFLDERDWLKRPAEARQHRLASTQEVMSEFTTFLRGRWLETLRVS